MFIQVLFNKGVNKEANSLFKRRYFTIVSKTTFVFGEKIFFS